MKRKSGSFSKTGKAFKFERLPFIPTNPLTDEVIDCPHMSEVITRLRKNKTEQFKIQSYLVNFPKIKRKLRKMLASKKEFVTVTAPIKVKKNEPSESRTQPNRSMGESEIRIQPTSEHYTKRTKDCFDILKKLNDRRMRAKKLRKKKQHRK